MARPIWTGAISFGLLHIPVRLMAAERNIDLHFHLLDNRDHNRVRYQRVNAETGEEVPWNDVVQAFEFSKGNYVVVEDEDIRNAASNGKETVEIEAFIDPGAISLRHINKPYYLVPVRRAEKGYVLLRDTLRGENKLALGRVVIRTRQYLAALVPEDDAIVLLLLRYPQELIAADEYELPAQSPKHYRISARESEMARELVASMSTDWKPEDYRDEFRERLSATIEARIGKGEATHPPEARDRRAADSGNVVDFMSLLKKSIAEQRRTPARGQARAAQGKRRGRARKSGPRKSGH